ncbi:hypothetical protein [uncultured Desulfovibrio sp.]|uniref:hypothetical protein n=1 Tax=uncultured Desulfovibrio sp. TaxID=167968 RepID=UPI0026327B97|nr:hypothetical protein [uncultured Desulfovibrio sp.]
MDIKDIHTGEGNYFDNICIDYDKAFALCDELFPHKRERERESLTYQTNTSNTDSFSLISYIYRKIPEPDPDRFYRLFPSVAYPFSYPFSASRLPFPQEFTVVIENKKFSEKILFFSVPFLFSLHTELPPAMIPPAWSAGVFFIYGPFFPSSLPGEQPRIRAPPPGDSFFGQTPEASLRRCPAVMRDAHV